MKIGIIGGAFVMALALDVQAVAIDGSMVVKATTPFQPSFVISEASTANPVTVEVLSEDGQCHFLYASKQSRECSGTKYEWQN